MTMTPTPSAPMFPGASSRKRRLGAISRCLAIASFGALVAACGGGGGDAAPVSPPPGSPAPGAPAPAPPPGGHVYGDVRGATLGVGAPLNGALPFPANNDWNADISGLPIDPNSDNLIASIGLSRGLFPDFGAGLWEGAPIGIPYVVVAGNQPRVAGGAVFHLDSNNVRPTARPRWTSADAAGLPIFPGLVRYDEASLGAGGIRHAPETRGMVVADNGSNWFLSGAPDERWNNDRLKSELRQVLGRDFEVVRMDGLGTP